MCLDCPSPEAGLWKPRGAGAFRLVGWRPNNQGATTTH